MGFSIQLHSALEELEEDDNDSVAKMSIGSVPSVVKRRKKHQAVANETEEQLHKLEQICEEQYELQARTSYQSDSLSFQE